MSKVINLFGGPGAGKSTMQSDLYSLMKKEGKKVEMVREVAKKWAWDKRPIGPLDQLNILGEQIKDESELYGKVDFIVTDSPILLGAFYMNYNHNQSFMTDMVLQYMKFAEQNGVKYYNFLLNRKGVPYKSFGRFQSEEKAKDLDLSLKDYLNLNKVEYVETELGGDDRIYEIAYKFLYSKQTTGY